MADADGAPDTGASTTRLGRTASAQLRRHAELPFGGTKVFDHRAITMHANDNAEHHPDNPKCPNAE